MMTTESNALITNNMDTSDLGDALQALFTRGEKGAPGQLHINELLAKAKSMNEDSMIGALKILSILGIVVVDKNGFVRATSKYGRFALGSMSEFLVRSLPIVVHADVDKDEERYLTTVTGAIETIRKDKIGLTPLYSIEIVNVIIKGKQIRNGRRKEVYLHVYHPKWKAYHLIGIGDRELGGTIDELAKRAMEVKLGIKNFQYDFDQSINPNPIEYIDISGSHGTITKYTINAKVVKEFHFNINNHLKKLIEKKDNGITESTFRWFTEEEIQNRVSDNNENIMQSTPRLMRNVDLRIVDNVAGNVDHLQKGISIIHEIGNRVDIKTAGIYGAIGITILTIGAILYYCDIFTSTIPFLENIGNIAGVISLILAILMFLLGIKKST